MAACWPLLPLSGGGRGSDSLGSQFDPAVRRVPMSGSSSLATRPPALPCTRLLAPHRSRAGPKSGRESRLAGFGTDTFWQELLSPHFWVKCWLQCRTLKASGFGLFLLWHAGPYRNFGFNMAWKCICTFDSLLQSFYKYLCYSLMSLTLKITTSPLAFCSQFLKQLNITINCFTDLLSLT